MDFETAVYTQDPFSCKDPCPYTLPRNFIDGMDHHLDMEYYSSSIVQANSDDPRDNWGEMGANSSASSEDGSCGGPGGVGFPAAAVAAMGRRKRRRARIVKNRDDLESQRMTHIAVERNRRRQMNEYLAVLRSMMPPSYVQRGDQASIIGGAINFVKELEQLYQSLKTHKETDPSSVQYPSSIFSDFFTFPQYSTAATRHGGGDGGSSASEAAPVAEAIADVEVAVVDGHANIKVRSRRQPAQLLKMVVGLHSLRLHVLHLTLTAADHVVLFSFCVKVDESCQLNSANEIAAVVYEMVCRIQGESCPLFNRL